MVFRFASIVKEYVVLHFLGTPYPIVEARVIYDADLNQKVRRTASGTAYLFTGEFGRPGGMKTALKIPAIAGNVHLGCTAQERARKQPVQLEIKIYFSKTPRMLTSDNIEDGPCYAEMSAVAQKAFAKKHYATIEHLCFECHQDLEKYLKKWKTLKKSRLITTLLKLRPPIKEIIAGSVFTIETKL